MSKRYTWRYTTVYCYRVCVCVCVLLSCVLSCVIVCYRECGCLVAVHCKAGKGVCIGEIHTAQHAYSVSTHKRCIANHTRRERWSFTHKRGPRACIRVSYMESEPQPTHVYRTIDVFVYLTQHSWTMFCLCEWERCMCMFSAFDYLYVRLSLER